MQFLEIKKIHDFVKNEKGWNFFELKTAYQDLQSNYRLQNQVGYDCLEQLKAYVFSRMPATYAVVHKLISNHFKEKNIESIVDFGCGVGTASLAFSAVNSNLKNCYLIEKNSYALGFAKEFLNLISPLINIHEYIPDKVSLSIMSYSLNELKSNWQETVLNLWEKSENLLIIEPGTNSLFNNLLNVRDFLIANGANIVAPCFNSKRCPLKNSSDWCHFQEKIARSKEVKFLKSAEKSFENEAYCYLIASRDGEKFENINNSRVIAEPRKHSGHMEIKLCSDGIIKNKTITSKDINYKFIKKSGWGSVYKNRNDL